MRTLLPSLLLLAGCGPRLACGPGTFEEDGLCLPDAPPPADTVADTAAPDTVDDTVAPDTTETVDTVEQPDTSETVEEPQDTVDTPVPAGKPPYIGDLVFTEDGGMNAFCQLHEDVYGAVDIRGLYVFDLDELDCLRSVVGNLTISAPGLTSINLPRLRSVGGQLSLTGTGVASTISLPVLEEVGGNVIINNPDGMQNLVSIDLRGLTTVGLDLRIDDTVAIYNLDLPALTSVGRHLWFRRHGVLESVDAPLLTTLGGALRVEDNPAITAISLPMVTAVGTAISSELAIEDNASLTDLTGIGAIRTVSGSLVIRGNGALPQATAQAFGAAITSVGGATVLSPNGP